MHRLFQQIALLSVLFGAVVLDLAAGEAPTVLPEFWLEGAPWLYAKRGDLEIRTRASQGSLFGPAKKGRNRGDYGHSPKCEDT